MEQLQPRYASDYHQDSSDVPSFEDDPPGVSKDNDDQDSGDVPSFEEEPPEVSNASFAAGEQPSPSS